MNQRIILLVTALAVAGCSTLDGSASANAPLIPDESIAITPKLSLSLTKIIGIGAVIGAIYLVYDPLAPNWKITEHKLAEDTFAFDLRMKRYHTGGEGEAMQVLRRRAAKLQADGGYADFQLLEYTEGIESKTVGANRYAEAKVKMLKKPLPRG